MKLAPTGFGGGVVSFFTKFMLISSFLVITSCGPKKIEEKSAAPTLETSPAIEHPDVAGRQVVTREKLDPPEPAPDFNLVNRDGQQVSLGSIKGKAKAIMISFIYTRCPEACPLVPSAYLDLQREFKDEVERGDLALVFITTDPENDTPKTLDKYTKSRGGKWYFLTGNESDLREVWRRYGIYREVRERIKGVVIYHSYKYFLIDKNGMIRYRYVGIWKGDDLIPDVREVLSQS